VDVEITGVPGINDALGQPVVHGHCTTCHNTPNIGSHSEFRMIDLGLTGADRRSPDVPLVTLRNKTTGDLRQTTDVGRALGTGAWADIGKFKVPTLRGVAARAPYFHDGSASSLEDVLSFYEKRFGVDFQGSKADNNAFLNAL
jgi:cytochrome c peroxidase